jgi:hypothetical protein
MHVVHERPGYCSSKKILGKVGQQLKSSSQSFGWFTKPDFVATAEYFKHLAPDKEFLLSGLFLVDKKNILLEL